MHFLRFAREPQKMVPVVKLGFTSPATEEEHIPLPEPFVLPVSAPEEEPVLTPA